VGVTGTLSQIARIPANNAIAEHQDPEMLVALDIAVKRIWREMVRFGLLGAGLRGGQQCGEDSR
jgi:hypothetical protein